MANVGFKQEGQDVTEIYVKLSEVPYYEGIFDVDFLFSGGLWASGNGTAGQLGTGNLTSRSSPVRVGTLDTWKTVVVNDNYALAIKDGGTLWAWGGNDVGQLGTGTVVWRSSPVQVGALTNWKTFGKTHGSHSLAIKTDGSLWAWGLGNMGQLGYGNFIFLGPTDRSSPVRIGALTDWLQVSGGIDFSHGIRTDGSLWAWGANVYGQLGNTNTTLIRSSPIQVGSLTNWKQVSGGHFFALATKTDGTLWAWGANASGQLGTGNVVFRSSPVQVGSLTDWSYVQCGRNFALAIKTDGSLWAWGDGDYGQLGVGNVILYSSPVRVGALNNWAKISCGSDIAAAIKTDGSLWAWGRNTSGQLGTGNVVHYSSPVQVGSLTSWVYVAAGIDSGITGTECIIGIKT